jgi:hypothetical protein
MCILKSVIINYFEMNRKGPADMNTMSGLSGRSGDILNHTLNH